jgi:CheY-like chemotaxis protein
LAGSILRDRRVLVVEDEYLTATALANDLRMIGSIVVGPVPSVNGAIEKIAAEPRLDAAVVDLNLGGVLAYDVADRLLARKIPFIFSSGHDHLIARRYPEIKNCAKPVLFKTLKESLAEAMSRAGDAGLNLDPGDEAQCSPRSSDGGRSPGREDGRRGLFSSRRRGLLSLGVIAAAAALLCLGAVWVAAFLVDWDCGPAYSYYGCQVR